MAKIKMTQEQKDHFLLTLATLWAEQDNMVLTELYDVNPYTGEERKLK